MFWKTNKQDKSDEETANAIVDFTEDMNNPVQVLSSMRLFLALTMLCWLVVLIIPNYLVSFFSDLGVGKISAIILGIPFGAAFYLAYTIIRYKIPDVEENKSLNSDLMGSMEYQSSANRRYYVWLGAILFGIINVILLGAVSFGLDHYGLYLFNY